MQRQKFKTKKEWLAWIEAGKCPAFIPNKPESSYTEDGWKDWQD